MRIGSLRLKVFRSHQETVLELDRFNFIRGPNGCGKSSMQMAVEFLLTGRCDMTHFIEKDWVATRATAWLATDPPVALRVVDCFRIKNGKTVAQENHYDPRPAVPPGG